MKTQVLAVLIAVVLTGLCGCGKQYPYVPASQEEMPSVKMAAVRNEAIAFSLSPVKADHDSDGVIQWEDPGMEAYVRLALGKPEGDILRSEVWEIQTLKVASKYPGHFNVSDGPWVFVGYDSAEAPARVHAKGEQFPNVKTLADLRHFDSLQCFSLAPDVAFHPNEKPPLDLSGLEQCRYLRDLELTDTELVNPELIGTLRALERLDLEKCIHVNFEYMDQADSLRLVYLEGCEIQSLEPLADLKNLVYLNIGAGADYPSLEPLTHSKVQYLDMGISDINRNQYENMDYEPISRIPNLIWLDLTNHKNVDEDVFNEILAGNQTLKYLNIFNTSAAKKGQFLDTSQLEICAMGCSVY